MKRLFQKPINGSFARSGILNPSLLKIATAARAWHVPIADCDRLLTIYGQVIIADERVVYRLAQRLWHLAYRWIYLYFSIHKHQS